MKTVKSQKKIDRIKDILVRRRTNLERSLNHYTEWNMDEKDNSARRARAYLIEITQIRLDEVNAILTLIDLKHPLDGEWSYVNMDNLQHTRQEKKEDQNDNYHN